jgi:hypothetical protein
MRRFAGRAFIGTIRRLDYTDRANLGEFGHVFVLVALQGEIMGVVFFGFRPLFIADA